MPAVTLRDIRERLRAHPHAVDALIALGTFGCILLGAATEPHGPNGQPRFAEREISGQTVLLAVLICGVLALRRRAPMPVLLLTGLISVVALVTGEGPNAGSAPEAPLVMAAVIALYTVTNTTDRRTSWRVGAVTVGVLTATSMLFGARPWYAQENLGILAWTALAAAVGEAVRNRRAFVNAIRERAERAERTREEEARRRVAEERMRIARELHDVVAHHIALVNVQAGVASHVMDQRPDQAKQALAHVRDASRHALAELQTTVGLLRQSGESTAPTEPAPGLEVLDELVDGFRHAGMSVVVDTSPPGAAAPLSSAVDLTAYRVVQEALTNVQKHAGSGAHAEVRIRRDAEALEIVVIDDGAGTTHTIPEDATPAGDPADPDAAHPAESAGGGHGLVGMRERAAALHGACETGPLPGGGFRVHVRLPLQTTAPRKETPA
ncbi:sensor histidine kinase [Streptomyces sp. 8N114]|uniref:sensor histidine kinase n=1 Tax=Streptomyces sp. 8N114 TaxID=3457419 RepID=UPI003FCF0BEF